MIDLDEVMSRKDMRTVSSGEIKCLFAEVVRLRELNDALYKSQTAANQECEIAEDKLAAAEDALQALYDYQNGCPLPTYRGGWTAAMVAAENVLRDVDERLEKQIAAKEVLE